MCMFFSVWGVSLAREAVLCFGDITNMAVPRFHVCHQGEKRKRTGLVLEFLFSFYFFFLNWVVMLIQKLVTKYFFRFQYVQWIQSKFLSLPLSFIHFIPSPTLITPLPKSQPSQQDSAESELEYAALFAKWFERDLFLPCDFDMPSIDMNLYALFPG